MQYCKRADRFDGREGPQSQAFYEAALEQAPLGIAMFDTTLGCILVNHWLAGRMNASPDKIIGCTITEIFAQQMGGAYSDHLAAICRHTLETGELYSASAWLPPVGLPHYEWTLKRIVVGGRAAGLLLTIMDVSRYVPRLQEMEKSRQLEYAVGEYTDALKLANKRFYTVFNTSPGIMAILDRQGSIIDVNNSFVSITGWTRNEAAGHTASELTLVSPETDEASRYAFWQDRRILNREIVFYTKDGQSRIGLMAATEIVLNEKVHMLINIDDITEIKTLQKEMLTLDRMNLVGQMAAGISHEVRNPLTTVRGFLQMLMKKEGCQLYRDHFELMISELDRANTIISEFLSVAKSKQSCYQEMDLNQIIKTMEPLLITNGIVTGKSVVLELRDVRRLNLNEKEIRQLLLNLVRNGLEAMPQAGVVTVRTCEEMGRVVLAVQDEGTGFPPHILERLGRPFLTSKVNGTGLGLSVCYGIAERHQATIEVQSTATGTTVLVKF